MIQFGKGLEDIWGAINATADFIVIGPLDKELHMSTRKLAVISIFAIMLLIYDYRCFVFFLVVSLFLIKIAKIPQPPKSRFSQGCILLTVHPKEIASKETGMEFHHYIPPKR